MAPWKVLAGLAAAAVVTGVGWFLGVTDRGPIPTQTPEGAVEESAAPTPPPVLAGRPEDGAAPARAPGSADAPADPLAMTVLVVTVTASPSGEAIAGARVLVREEEGKDLASESTGPDGIVRFPGLLVDRVEVLTRAAGRTPEWTIASELRGRGERSIRVVLEPGIAMPGVVLAALSRRPVAGARVTARIGGSIAGRSTAYAGPPLEVTQADAEGRFHVEGVPLKEIVSIDVEAPGFAAARRSFMHGDGATEHPPVEIVLDAAAIATGRVTDPDGRPVAGARVHALLDVRPADAGPARLEAQIGPWGTDLDPGPQATTDAEGRYTLDGLLVRAAYRFFARAPGLARSALTDPPHTVTVPGPFALRDLALRRPATLRVRVVEPGGAPLEQARVAMPHRGLDLVPEREGAGVFRFDLLPAGAYEVLVEHPARVPSRLGLEILDGATREERLVLEMGVAVEGQVVDDRGVPVPGAGVSIGVGSAAADAEGRFRVEGLEAGRHGASATAKGHAHAPQVEVETPSTGVRLVLPRSASIRVRLISPAGTPLPSRIKSSIESLVEGGGSGSEREWENGLIVIEEVPPEPTRVVLHVEGFAPVEREVDLSPGENHDLGTVTLDAGVELVGQVVDGAAHPLPGARVRVSLPGFMDAAVGTAGPEGRFRVARLPRGKRVVRVDAQGLLAGREEVVLDGPTTRLTFTLVPAVRVTGTVRDGAGRGVEGVRVAWLLQGEAPLGVPRECDESTDATGAWEVEVAAGTHRVEVRGEENRVLLRRDAPITVPMEAPLELVIP